MRILIFDKSYLTTFLIAICAILFTGNNSIYAQNGCTLVKKNEPVIFISFERIIEKNKARILQLRLNNNSTCTIVVPVKYEERTKESSESKACVTSTFGELENNSTAFLGYEITDSKTNTIYFPYSGCVISSSLLKGGQSVLFEIPVKEYKKGDFSLRFAYDWEVCSDFLITRKLSFYSLELEKLIK